MTTTTARRLPQRLIALVRLSRPITCISAAFAVFVAGLQGHPAATAELLRAALSAALLAAAGDMYNDVVDLPVDRINRPDRALPRGLVEPRAVLAVAAVLALAALALAVTVSAKVFAAVLAAAFLLFLYSRRLKNTVLAGNLTVAGLVGLLFVDGGLAGGGVQGVLPLSLAATAGILAREVLKTIVDRDGDAQVGLHTVATAWGLRRSLRLFIVLVGLFVLASLAPILTGRWGLPYLIIVLAGALPIVLFSAISAVIWPSAQRLRRVLALQKVVFFVWLCAVASNLVS